jgi:hypothetical protein
MKAAALLCIPLRHRWREAPDIHETYPVLRCTRCGKLRELADGTGDPLSFGGKHRTGVEQWSGKRPGGR